MISLSDCFLKTVAKLTCVIKQLVSDIQHAKGKALLVFVIMGVIFWLVDNKLAALLIMSAVPIIAFRWDARVYFALALLFLVGVPGFLIAKNDYWAEQLAVYTYYFLSLGVLVELINYVRESQKAGVSLSEQATGWARIHINTSILIIVISLWLIGFYYLNDKFTVQLAEQTNLLMRMGGYGYKVAEEDKEIARMKQQLKEVITVLENSVDKRIDRSAESDQSNRLSNDSAVGDSGGDETGLLPGAVTVEILNGGNERGAAKKLSDKLEKVGFKVVSIGNAVGDFTTTSIRYKTADKQKAEIVAAALADTTYVWKFEEETDISQDVLVIIGSLKN